jgi:hypothetical protein
MLTRPTAIRKNGCNDAIQPKVSCLGRKRREAKGTIRILGVLELRALAATVNVDRGKIVKPVVRSQLFVYMDLHHAAQQHVDEPACDQQVLVLVAAMSCN